MNPDNYLLIIWDLIKIQKEYKILQIIMGFKKGWKKINPKKN